MEDPKQPVDNEETELTRLTPTPRYCNIAVRVGDCIVVTGGLTTCDYNRRLPLSEVWLYNLYTDKWSKYLIPPDKETPEDVKYGQGVVIGGDIYLLCISKSNGKHALWVLKNPLDKTAAYWENVGITSQDQQPSPREAYGCWAYDGNLWIFGGEGLDDDGEPTEEFNNQLISFDTGTKAWNTRQCSGNIPSARTGFGSDIIDDKVWLFGGGNALDEDRDYLYMLNMESEPYVWTRILLPSTPAALELIDSSFTSVNNSLVLNAISRRKSGIVQETWIIDLASYSWSLHSCCDEMRNCHASCKGLNNDVIVTGGHIYERNNNSADPCSKRRAEGNFMRHIVPQPKSLEQLALKAVHTHRNILPWKDPLELPRHLITRLQELPAT